MNKFAAVNLYAPRQILETRRPSSVVRRSQNHLRTALDLRRATFFEPTEEHRKTRQLASRLTEVRTLANFVRSSDLTQAFPLTTGTFNLIVKDRFAFPPERRVFSPSGSRNESSRPRNLLKISFYLRPSQSTECTGFPHEIRRSSLVVRRTQLRFGQRPTTASSRSKTHLPPAPAPDFIEKTTEKLTIGTSRSEDDRLRKDPMEVLAIRDLNLA